MSFSLASSQFTTRPWSFSRDVETYAHLGYTHIEICEEKLVFERLDEQFGQVAEAGLQVCAIQPVVRTFLGSAMQPEPSDPAKRFERLVSSIERLAQYAPGVPFITNTGAPEEGDVAGACAYVSERLGELGPMAASHGVKVALEPLNPTTFGTESAIWTLDQGLAIVETAGHEAIGLCLDAWNIWQQAKLEAAIARAAGRIFSVQLSDWRLPRSGMDRLVPGDGEIPLGAFVRAVRQAGFSGPLTVEIFSDNVPDALWHSDLEQVLERSHQAMGAAGQRGSMTNPKQPRRRRRDGRHAKAPLLHRRRHRAGAVDLRPARKNAQAAAALCARVP